MLLHQAVRGFERWFGIKPEVTPELRALVEADLDATKPEAAVAPQEKVKPQAKRARGNKERG